MMHDLGRLLTQKSLTFADANEIAEDMSLELASLRNAGDISNDAFLEAGVIQGSIPRRLVAKCCIESLKNDKSINKIIEVTSSIENKKITFKKAMQMI